MLFLSIPDLLALVWGVFRDGGCLWLARCHRRLERSIQWLARSIVLKGTDRTAEKYMSTAS
jgi:hypothetical protein